MPGNKPEEFNELRDIVSIYETIAVVGPIPQKVDGWEVITSGPLPQMMCEELKPKGRVDAVLLTADDVPEILELVSLAQPGPFLSRTIEMGRYIGIRQDGQLVAMAGERVHLPGYCEISAVCTHPEYRGRGYGSALTTMVTEEIIARKEIPILHLAPSNEVAMKLYKKLGFRVRKESLLTLLKRIN
jgi:predicted GNAT family acetyltransferase